MFNREHTALKGNIVYEGKSTVTDIRLPWLNELEKGREGYINKER
jgi:hypothetical protein